MKIARNDALRTHEDGIAGASPLTEQDLQAVVGGGEQFFGAYYDVSTGRYTLVPQGQVYFGGLYVGDARLNS
jgi:hypothetical protein